MEDTIDSLIRPRSLRHRLRTLIPPPLRSDRHRPRTQLRWRGRPPEKAPERLLWPAFNYGCTWRCQDGILWPMVVHRARLACTMVAGARSGRKNEGLYVMYFQYVICICGTGDNLCIPLPEGTVIPLPEGTVKITLENPAPLLAGPDRAWSQYGGHYP